MIFSDKTKKFTLRLCFQDLSENLHKIIQDSDVYHL